MPRQFANPKDRQKPRVEHRLLGVATKSKDKADEVFVYGSDGRVIFCGSPDDWSDLTELFGGEP